MYGVSGVSAIGVMQGENDVPIGHGSLEQFDYCGVDLIECHYFFDPKVGDRVICLLEVNPHEGNATLVLPGFLGDEPVQEEVIFTSPGLSHCIFLFTWKQVTLGEVGIYSVSE